jgi:nucleotide-binding universal stress UspA family protein
MALGPAYHPLGYSGEVDRRPVICGFEASGPARHAVEAADWLADALRTSLEVIHVFDSGGQPALPLEGALRDPVISEEVRRHSDRLVRARMSRILEGIAESLPGEDIKTAVLDGLVVPTLHDAAAERRAMLLVVGTAARVGLRHVVVGSVAGSLATNAPCPVVTVPPGSAIAEPGPVLVGDDGSEHAVRAVGHAVALAERLGRAVVRMKADGDDPVQQLASAGREHRACLIVTGTRGRGPTRAELLGSVSTGLVQARERPIVIVSASAAEASGSPG